MSFPLWISEFHFIRIMLLEVVIITHSLTDDDSYHLELSHMLANRWSEGLFYTISENNTKDDSLEIQS